MAFTLNITFQKVASGKITYLTYWNITFNDINNGTEFNEKYKIVAVNANSLQAKNLLAQEVYASFALFNSYFTGYCADYSYKYLYKKPDDTEANSQSMQMSISSSTTYTFLAICSVNEITDFESADNSCFLNSNSITQNDGSHIYFLTPTADITISNSTASNYFLASKIPTGNITLGKSETPAVEISVDYETLENCTTNTDSVFSGNETTIVLTANDDYEFTENPTIKINDDTYNFTISDDKQYATYTFTPSETDDITVNATATKIIKYIDILFETLENCYADISQVTENVSTILTLTANTGYQFDTTPIFIFNTTYNDFTVSDDKKTATYIITATTDDTLTVIAKATETEITPETINIQTSLKHCTLNYYTVTVDTETLLILTANSGYEFTENPTIQINDVTRQFSISETKDIAFITITPETNDVIIVTGSANEITTVEYIATITYSTVNVTITPTPTTYKQGDTLTLVATIADNCNFDYIPRLFTNIYDGTTEEFNFTKVSDTEYSFTFPTDDFYKHSNITYEIKVSASASIQTVTKDKYGLIQLYKPTSDVLNSLATARFIDLSSGELYDLAQYITSLKRIYLNVETAGSQNIILGNNDTKILCDTINNDDVELDLGNYEIIGNFQNALDNKYLQIKIILPFIGVIDLDSELYANKTINITYKINLISGTCVALISIVNGSDTFLIEKYQGTCGFDVPYILKDNELTVYNAESNSDNIFNAEPCIILIENEKANGTNEQYYKTDIIDTIGNIEATYIKIEKIINTNSNRIMLKNEIDTIEKILQQGIYL